MVTEKALEEKPHAGNPHIRFDSGKGAPVSTPRCRVLLYKRVVLAAIAVAMALPALSAMRYWKASPENNWNWTNPNNFTDGVTPSCGDTIVVPEGLEVHVKADDADSWSVACSSPTVVQVRNSGSYVVFDVPEGASVTNFAALQTAWDAQYLSKRDSGGLLKRGLGKLTLKTSTAQFAYYTTLKVEAGELEIDVGAGQEIGTLFVAGGATATISGQNLKIAGFEGAGTIRRTSRWSAADHLVGSKEMYEFSGTLTENMYVVCDNRQYFTGIYSTMTSLVSSCKNDGKLPFGPCVGVSRFGTTGEPSSIGVRDRVVLGTGSGGVRYLGSGETTAKNIELDTTLTGPSFIDGGENGGLVWNGDLMLSSWREQAVSFAFIGDHTNLCTFGGKIFDQSYKGRTVYVTKDGTGVWRFVGNKAYNGYISGVAVRNGILQFASIAERGTDCSFGKMNKLAEDFSGTDSEDSHLVPYAYVLGGFDTNNVANATALLEYVGTSAAKVTTRPAVLNGRGGFKSSSASFDFTGVTSKEAESNILLLDGDGATNIVRSVTNGLGTVGIEKNGSGTWVVAGTNDFTGPVSVNGGVLRFANVRPRYRWYRLVIKEMVSGNCLALTYLGLYDENGVSVTDGFTKGTLATLQPGQVATDKPFEVHSSDYAMGGDIDKAFLFDSSIAGGFFYKTSPSFAYIKPQLADESTWCRIVLRLPENANAVTSYDFVRTGSPEWRNKYQIRSWSLEASVDGVSWTEVHETQTKDLNSGWGNYWASRNDNLANFTSPVHKTGITIPSHADPVGALPTPCDWSVAGGATIVNENDETIVISKFTVDASKGIGELTNFEFAPSGVLDVRNLEFADGETSMSLGDFSGSAGFGNVANWTFLIDGEAPKKYRVAISGNSIVVKRSGFVMILH